MMKMERLQINEVVQYHISNQNNLRVNRITITSIVKPKMSREREIKYVLQDKQYNFFNKYWITII